MALFLFILNKPGNILTLMLILIYKVVVDIKKLKETKHMTNFIIKEDHRELEIRSEELVLYFYKSPSKKTIQRVSGTVQGTNLRSDDGIRYTKSGRGKVKNASTVGALIEAAEDHLRKNNYYFS